MVWKKALKISTLGVVNLDNTQKIKSIGLKDEDYHTVYFIYDESLKSENFFIAFSNAATAFSKKKDKKYTSKDIADIRFVKKKDTDGLTDVIFGKSTFHYLEIELKKGIVHSYQVKSSEDRAGALRFIDKYLNK